MLVDLLQITPLFYQSRAHTHTHTHTHTTRVTHTHTHAHTHTRTHTHTHMHAHPHARNAALANSNLVVAKALGSLLELITERKGRWEGGREGERVSLCAHVKAGEREHVLELKREHAQELQNLIRRKFDAHVFRNHSSVIPIVNHPDPSHPPPICLSVQPGTKNLSTIV